MIEKYIILMLTGYLIFYPTYNIIRFYFPFTEKLIFCSMCSSFFSVLILSIIFKFPSILIAFMLGMSVTGIAFKTNQALERRNERYIMQHFLLQLAMTIIGLTIIFLFYANWKEEKMTIGIFQKKPMRMPRDKSNDCEIIRRVKPDGTMVAKVRGEGCTPERVKALMEANKISPEEIID